MGNATHFRAWTYTIGSVSEKGQMESMILGNQTGRSTVTLLVTALSTLALSAAAMAAEIITPTVASATFYSAAIAAVIVFFLFNAALRNRIGMLYAALFAVMLVLIWVLEGGLLDLLPQLGEQANRFIGLLTGLIGCALGFHAAGQAIDPQREMKFVRRLFRDLAVVSLVLTLGAWFWPYGLITLVIDILLGTMFVAHLVSALTWRTIDGKPFRLPAITALLLLLSVACLFLFYGTDGEALRQDYVLRWLFALVALPGMAGIGMAVFDLRRAHERAMAAAVAAARKDAETSAALLDMEKNYSRARDTAASRTRQIATATHDIRQPLAALRGELDALKGPAALENTERIDRILDHFDALTDDLARSGQGQDAPPLAEVAEDVPATLLLRTLQRMFETEARDENIDLRIVQSSATFHAPAVILMRIAGNLIANAIQHAQATRILVGVRHKGNQLWLIVRDDGIGFGPPGIAASLETGVKGAASEGSGLGLSIVRELAEDQGFDLQYNSVRGEGTAFSITVPRA